VAAPFEKPDVRSALDIAASHINAASIELRLLFQSRGDMMSEDAKAALSELTAKLEALCDDERADHASGDMCDVVEALKVDTAESLLAELKTAIAAKGADK
jgi:hypothetical protein